MKTPLLQGNKMRILLHIAAWTILLGLPLYFINRWNIGKDFIWAYYINNIINGLIFYVNYLFLIPAFFFGAKKFKYYISVMLLIGSFYLVSDISNGLIFKYTTEQRKTEEPRREPLELRKDSGPPDRDKRFGRPPFRQMHRFNFFFTSLFITFFSLGLRVLERNAQIEKRQKDLEKEKLNSELALLKNQISPHFFFNTLNNIYSLISINTADSQKAVLQLSKLMRYLLYESEQGQSLLSHEIEFMNNYIDLMRLRMSDKVALSVSFPVQYENMAIPPLLFIPFIENAFKHGISYREKSFIEIDMKVEKESLTFRSSNSIGKAGDESGQNHSGIGLDNVSKRLNLLFPGKHELKINKSDASFDVYLVILFDIT